MQLQVGEIYKETLSDSSIALLFGNESDGLTAQELSFATDIVEIPTASAQGSMNLSHAVGVGLARVFDDCVAAGDWEDMLGGACGPLGSLASGYDPTGPDTGQPLAAHASDQIYRDAMLLSIPLSHAHSHFFLTRQSSVNVIRDVVRQMHCGQALVLYRTLMGAADGLDVCLHIPTAAPDLCINE